MYREKKIDNSDRDPVSMAIPLSSENPHMYDGNGSREVKKYSSIEEEKIDTLCDGVPLDLDVAYDISEKCKKTKFMLHLIPFSKGNVRHVSQKIRDYGKNIVVHEVSTGTHIGRKTRDDYIKLIDDTNANGGNVGYHFLCDSDLIICFLPWDEVAYHATSLFYNSKSIGVERMVNLEAGVDALYNQAKLIATIMYMENIPLHKVITHYDACYTRKLPVKDENGNVSYDANGEVIYYLISCPDRLIHGQFGGLLAFRQIIVNCLRTHDLFVEDLMDLKKQIEVEDKKELRSLHLNRVEDLTALTVVENNSEKNRLK